MVVVLSLMLFRRRGLELVRMDYMAAVVFEGRGLRRVELGRCFHMLEHREDGC